MSEKLKTRDTETGKTKMKKDENLVLQNISPYWTKCLMLKGNVWCYTVRMIKEDVW